MFFQSLHLGGLLGGFCGRISAMENIIAHAARERGLAALYSLYLPTINIK